MSEISPPPPPSPGPPGAPPAPPQLPAATTLPPAQTPLPIPQSFIDAAIGARFDAQIVSLTQQGLLTLRGDFGQVQLQLQNPLSLNQGDTVALQLGNRGTLLQFLITSVNGEAATLAARAGSATAAANIANALAATGSTQPVFKTGTLLSATLLRPAPGALNPQATLSQPSPGAPTPSFSGTNPTISPTAPSSGPIPGATSQSQAAPPSTTTPGTGSGTAPTVGQNAPPGSPGSPPGTAPPGGTGTLPAGTQFTVQVTSLQPPPPGGASAVVPPTGQALTVQGQVLTGIVTGTTTGSGQPIIETVLGPVAINASNAPAEGTRVTLTIASAPQPPVTPAPVAEDPSMFLRQSLFLNREWPALNETLQTLEQAAPNAAMQVLQTAIARPDANLAANILLFVSALRGGDLRSWLGDQPTRALQRVSPGLLGRMRDDLGQQSRLADERSPGDWRMAMVPFHNGEALDQIRLLTRHQQDEEDEDPENASTRFVVDVKLTKLGHIQLDGLVNTGRHRMDMVVRSDNHLPSDVKNDIRHLYEKSGEITGYRGGVGFQSQPANFIEVEPPAKPEGGIGLTV